MSARSFPVAAAATAAGLLALALAACTAAPPAASPAAPATVTVTVTPQPDRPPAITEQVLNGLTAPPMCEREARALVDGTLPGIPEGEGDTTLASNTDHPQLWAQSTDPQGNPSLVVAFSCNLGGVEWPQVLGFYGTRGDLLASYDLGSLDELEHSDVSSISYRGGVFHVEWLAYDGAGFGPCGGNEPAAESGDFYIADGKVVVASFDAPCRGD